MFLNCVNADVVAQKDARQKAKELSNVARQRVKELAETGSSKIQPIRSPVKSSTSIYYCSDTQMMLRRSINLPVLLSPTSTSTSTSSLSSSLSSLSSPVQVPTSPLKRLSISGGRHSGTLGKISEDLTSILKHDAINKVQTAIEKVEVSISDAKNKRSLNLELAKERLNEAYTRCSPVSNKIVSRVAMDRVNDIEGRIQQLENILVGLKELSVNIRNDIVVVGDDIDKDIQEIMMLLDKTPKRNRSLSNEEMLEQITLLSLDTN